MTEYRDGKPRCEARVGVKITEAGFEPVTCHQYIGLRSFEAGGQTHRYCNRPGHEANVRARVARLIPPTASGAPA